MGSQQAAWERSLQSVWENMLDAAYGATLPTPENLHPPVHRLDGASDGTFPRTVSGASLMCSAVPLALLLLLRSAAAAVPAGPRCLYAVASHGPGIPRGGLHSSLEINRCFRSPAASEGPGGMLDAAAQFAHLTASLQLWDPVAISTNWAKRSLFSRSFEDRCRSWPRNDVCTRYVTLPRACEWTCDTSIRWYHRSMLDA